MVSRTIKSTSDIVLNPDPTFIQTKPNIILSNVCLSWIGQDNVLLYPSFINYTLW